MAAIVPTVMTARTSGWAAIVAAMASGGTARMPRWNGRGIGAGGSKKAREQGRK
jgi:hypothetical protein